MANHGEYAQVSPLVSSWWDIMLTGTNSEKLEKIEALWYRGWIEFPEYQEAKEALSQDGTNRNT